MAVKAYYNQILTEHNLRPLHKSPLKDANLTLRGVNPSCGDNIVLQLRVDENNIIADGAFLGDGCAISQASADMMLDLVIGREKEEALHLADLFMRMIRGEASPGDLEALEEAASLEDVSHMPARVKCAVLGWHTLTNLLGKS